MVRVYLAGFIFVVLLCISGCGMSGQQTGNSDDGFREQNENFEKQRADFITRDAESVRGYQNYMNQQP